jgi:hypothetical protein
MENEANLREIRHCARSLARAAPRLQLAIGILSLGLALGAAACSSSGSQGDAGCAQSCTQNSDCGRIVCNCVGDGSVNIDGFCSDGCCGGCPPGCQ